MRRALWLFAAPLVVAYNSQTPWKSLSTTLVDLLNADPDYTLVLHLLQRARLIPTLNKLNDSTFFAPTNDAIHRYILWNNLPPLESDGPQQHEPTWSGNLDNINEQLRQRLLYHLLNNTLPHYPPEGVEVLKTLHFPRIPLEPPTQDPPPNPPWLPIPGGSLNSEPQRLRIAVRDGSAYVGVDANGESGTLIVKEPAYGTNSVLIGIGDMMDVPADLATIVRKNPALTYVAKILRESQFKILESTPGLTVFLPEDDAWKELHPVERLYLESEFAEEDLKWILGMHAANSDIGWSDTFGKHAKIRTIEGNKLDVEQSSSGYTVSGADLLQRDVYAANGVLHTVSSLLLPPGSLTLTPEKYLLALNCTTFISYIHSVDLTHLISNPNAAYTILAPRDDVLSVAGGDWLPEKGTIELKKSLQYHFIPGKWTSNKLKDGLLLETELVEEGLAGGRQVLDVGISTTKDPKGDKSRKELYFAGAGVVGDPIEINNTLIYLVTRPLSPPVDVLTAALPSLHLSTYLAAVFSTSLANTVKNLPRTTFLIPRNSAWERLGLVTSYLLMSTAKSDLESVILHHALDSVQYLHVMLNGTDRSFRTVEGTDVSITRRKDSAGKTEVLIGPSGGWDGLTATLAQDSDGRADSQLNTLTETGVMHELDGLLIPRSVEITLGKLVRAAGGGTMASLVARAGMEWVLNGTAPPPDSEWANLGEGIGWTLLCPKDDAWKAVNLTKLWDDEAAVRELVAQHLIPTAPNSDRLGDMKDKGKNLPPPKDGSDPTAPLNMDDASHGTARSKFSAYGDIVFMKSGNGEYLVGIKGARGTAAEEDWAKVMTWGRSTVSTSPDGPARGGVIKIDRVLEPYTPRWWVRWGPPTASVAGVVLALASVGYGVRWYIRKKASEPTYEPVGRDPEEDG